MAMHIWGGDPMIKVVLSETRQQLDDLDPSHPETETCIRWWEEAEDCLKQKFFGFFLPYHAYDQIWALLNRIRHLLCRSLPVPRLLFVLMQIREGLSYVQGVGERKNHSERLAEIENSLVAITSSAATSPAPTMSMDEIRFELERISRLVAGAREFHWRKVNMLRSRLITTAVILMALLVSIILLAPLLTGDGCVHPQNLLIIAAFGALGGLVSALRTMESLDAPSSAYYIQRTLLGLRPVVGAAAGVIVYLIQSSGMLVILPDSDCPTAAQLALAFIAGFSQRFFVAQIESIIKSRMPSADKKEVSDK